MTKVVHPTGAKTQENIHSQDIFILHHVENSGSFSFEQRPLGSALTWINGLFGVLKLQNSIANYRTLHILLTFKLQTNEHPSIFPSVPTPHVICCVPVPKD